MEREKREMEVATIRMSGKNNEEEEEEEDEEGKINSPGFRFHPTDEELVSFYLKRKVEEKPMEVIKPIDVYKYDPWDLPSNVGEEELYFFCKRGRKYRNSERPNRVTGSGFWKATGIDKPIHASTGQEEPHKCIGLKKSLVYYRGNAGKGTKTDWMMHEFRLPPTTRNLGHHSKDVAREEAEVWTLCRIFKRLPSPRKHTPDLKPNTTTTSVNHSNPADSSSKARSGFESEQGSEQHTSFGYSAVGGLRREPAAILPAMDGSTLVDDRDFSFLEGYLNSTAHQQPPILGDHPGFWNPNSDELVTYGDNWDELGPVVERAANHKSHDLDRT